jgi:hypothetical protein
MAEVAIAAGLQRRIEAHRPEHVPPDREVARGREAVVLDVGLLGQVAARVDHLGGRGAITEWDHDGTAGRSRLRT